MYRFLFGSCHVPNFPVTFSDKWWVVIVSFTFLSLDPHRIHFCLFQLARQQGRPCRSHMWYIQISWCQRRQALSNPQAYPMLQLQPVQNIIKPSQHGIELEVAADSSNREKLYSCRQLLHSWRLQILKYFETSLQTFHVPECDRHVASEWPPARIGEFGNSDWYHLLSQEQKVGLDWNFHSLHRAPALGVCSVWEGSVWCQRLW